MINLKHMLLFVGWISCLGGAYVATTQLTFVYKYLPQYIAWCVFIFVALVFLAKAILCDRQTRNVFVGSSIFAIAAIVLVYIFALGYERTPGSIVADLFLFGEQPNSYSNPSEIESRNTWIAQRNGVLSLVDLFFASCMTMFGAYLGASHKPSDTADRNDNHNTDECQTDE